MDPSLVLDRVTLRVPEREIPLPAHLSEAARTYLATAAMQPQSPLPATADPQAWHAAAAAWNERFLTVIEPLLAGLPVTLETHRVRDCNVYIATPHDLAGPAATYALMDIHGGALVFGAGRFTELITIWRSVALGCRVFGVDYRMPPSHPYPAALDDCMAAYRYLLNKYHRAHVAISGISSGGNLAAATILRARDEGLPLPAAVLLLTPEVDLTEQGDSFFTNRDVDVALREPLRAANLLYAGGADLTDPYISPLFGDFSRGFAPTFLQAGTRDLFLSNTVRMHRALLRAGQQAELHVWEAMPHAGFGGGTPEDVEMLEAMRDFLRRIAGWVL